MYCIRKFDLKNLLEHPTNINATQNWDLHGAKQEDTTITRLEGKPEPSCCHRSSTVLLLEYPRAGHSLCVPGVHLWWLWAEICMCGEAHDYLQSQWLDRKLKLGPDFPNHATSWMRWGPPRVLPPWATSLLRQHAWWHWRTKDRSGHHEKANHGFPFATCMALLQRGA